MTKKFFFFLLNRLPLTLSLTHLTEVPPQRLWNMKRENTVSMSQPQLGVETIYLMYIKLKKPPLNNVGREHRDGVGLPASACWVTEASRRRIWMSLPVFYSIIILKMKTLKWVQDILLTISWEFILTQYKFWISHCKSRYPITEERYKCGNVQVSEQGNTDQRNRERQSSLSQIIALASFKCLLFFACWATK